MANVVCAHQALEKFMKEAKTVATELDRTYLQITERLSRDDKITPQELLRQHRSLQESVIYIPERTIHHGGKMSMLHYSRISLSRQYVVCG